MPRLRGQLIVLNEVSEMAKSKRVLTPEFRPQLDELCRGGREGRGATVRGVSLSEHPCRRPKQKKPPCVGFS